MKRRMIVCITFATILLVVGTAYWAFCRLPHFTGSVIKEPDSYRLDARYMNGTDGHTMTLNAGDVLAIRFETEKGTLHLENFSDESDTATFDIGVFPEDAG